MNKTLINSIKIIAIIIIVIFFIYILPRDGRVAVPEGSADISVEQTVRNVIESATASSGPFMVCSNGVCMPKGVTAEEMQKKLDSEKEKSGASRLSRAKELVEPTSFINAEPFKVADLVGRKVILVDFWTYSCINCQHVIPYLNDWYAKYKDKGLEIVSIHSPEFEYEKNEENVRDAVTKFGIKYPVVMDNKFGTWNAYQNKFWPRIYVIDLNGNIVTDYIGEGNYDEMETRIRGLLGL